MKRWMPAAVGLLLLLCLLPLAGVLATGGTLRPYIEFPPLTHRVVHPPFRWSLFLAGWALCVVALVSLLRVLWPRLRQADRESPPPAPAGRFPWWGFAGGVLCLASWWVAWGGPPGCESVQRHTFAPLWIGCILILNGLTQRRTGTCPLRRRPGPYLLLFPVSAVFWWFFEYLNRFTQNWHYLGVEEFSGGEYVFLASVSFATVLPAVAVMRELLLSLPRLEGTLRGLPALPVSRPKSLAWAVLVLAGVAMAGLGVYPAVLFPLVWVAPLLVAVSAQVLCGDAPLLEGPSRGDWRLAGSAALAALLCGFLWELWNWQSLARWEYSVPFVGRFRIFAMPILGYLGYLPFGLECAVLIDPVLGPVPGLRPADPEGAATEP
ncbi:MAG: hypothetical protein JXR77_12165 [Lentisphaeria bacterium]|nr:hypothetical protein [Lentisphaeria bacterium]